MKNSIQELSKKIKETITEKDIQTCSKLLEQTINNIGSVIGQHIEIHKRQMKNNDTYSRFVKNTIPEESYKKLMNLGESRKYINTANNVRSFGLFGLTKKVFGFSDKRVEQKFNDYLNNIDDLLEATNISIETGSDFTITFLTLITAKEIALKTFTSYVNDFSIN